MQILITFLFILCIPILLKFFEKTKVVATISPIALAYASGIFFSFASNSFHKETIKQLTELSIALSISLFVLSSSIAKFGILLKPLLKSFFLGIISLLIAILFTFLLFTITIDNKIAILSMLVGLYVGGTPNLNAIGMALEVPNETIILVNTADIALGGIYFLLLITIIKPLLSYILPQYTFKNVTPNNEITYHNKIIPLTLKIKMIVTFLISGLVILAISFGLVQLWFGTLNIPIFLIVLTTLSIIGAHFSYIKKLALKFETADFLLLLFSFCIGLQINIDQLFNNGLEIYLLVGTVFFSTILIHILLAYVTKIDVDTLMISSTAALFGPAFIAPIAKAINNSELIVYGIAVGLLGYILGNYLGLGVSWILHFLG